MKTRRRDVLALVAGALAAPLRPFAQQPAKVARIGFLHPGLSQGVNAIRLNAFRDGLRELGYIEGQNSRLEIRWAEGNLQRLPSLAAELVQLKVDVIVAANFSSVLAARQATQTIPIVTPQSNDPVGDRTGGCCR